MRILAVDPGEKRLGIAISDPTGSIATPHSVLRHKSKLQNAQRIIALAEENQCEIILVGAALNEDGKATESSRRAANLAKVIAENTNLPVRTWDESGSTKAAKAYAIKMGYSKNKRRGHLDDTAAAIILQSYLDETRQEQEIDNE